jgi:hypothetical protein
MDIGAAGRAFYKLKAVLTKIEFREGQHFQNPGRRQWSRLIPPRDKHIYHWDEYQYAADPCLLPANISKLGRKNIPGLCIKTIGHYLINSQVRDIEIVIIFLQEYACTCGDL